MFIPKSASVVAAATTMVLSGAAALGLLIVPAAHAELVEQTLHGFCGTSAATSTCSSNGTITPTNQNPLSPFGFTRSPDSNQNLTTPTFTLIELIPDNAPGATSETLTETGEYGVAVQGLGGCNPATRSFDGDDLPLAAIAAAS